MTFLLVVMSWFDSWLAIFVFFLVHSGYSHVAPPKSIAGSKSTLEYKVMMNRDCYIKETVHL